MKKSINLSNEVSLLWQSIIEKTVEFANFVEFNVLYEDKEILSFIEEYSSDYMGENISEEKFYESGKSIRFTISEKMKSFLSQQDFSYWYNKPLEDPSFFYKDKEILATITHEDVLIVDIDRYKSLDEILSEVIMYDIL